MLKNSKTNFILFILIMANLGCASLFGWKIHAPGTLSQNYFQNITPMEQRIALYFPPELLRYQSTNRGGKLADPQTYYVGEALGPMLIEGFQEGFSEFIFLENEPTVDTLRQYGIPYVVIVRPKSFDNRVTLKGQAVALTTEAVILDQNLNNLALFESKGVSDARKIFAKKGGPEVNLNAAIENNIQAIVSYLQDSIRSGKWN